MRGRDIAILGGVIVLLAVLLGLAGGGMMRGWGVMGPSMMGWFGYGFNPLGWVIMLLFWVLLLGGIAALVVWLLRAGPWTPAGEGGPSPALDILKERYVRGEITREQLDEMKREIAER